MKQDKGTPEWRLAEVWNDTVDLRQLAWAIVIGVGISVTAFFLASRWLRGVVASPELAHAYAMLAGLAGCVLAGVICAKRFPPKRVVNEEGAVDDPAWRAEVLAELAAQPGGLGTVADLPPATVQELKELGLYALFAEPADAPAPAAAAAPGARATPPARTAQNANPVQEALT
ncbi:hypothetical protein [Bordetella genomosp. 1]|uniref:Uncharacterized protein n=1 Tax=Bordetella genomosp. 1 TaxID=1395607 RepID=A0ABX4EZE7_9BORD|nr:hypothetical protein [Bordetella genomosp. 1]OZI64044.1 hypothetical protein CAL27_15790 [Bordetella genomosp. 1]